MTGPARPVADDRLAGFPAGLADLLVERWQDLTSRLGAFGSDLDAGPDDGTASRLADLLLAPRLFDESWPEPAAPIPVAGGWVHAELIDDDRPLFEAVLAATADQGPLAVATAAQELRLPVSPYRRLGEPDPIDSTGSDPDGASGAGAAPGSNRRSAPAQPTGQPKPLTETVIVDLTTHWAGPLATKLLADAGATVIKVDPHCRPDGFRERPALYDHLNGSKDIVDLDLRREPDRARFERLLARADVLIESFSRRVMPNLGYDQDRLAALAPRLGTVSIKAHKASSPYADWLAYGPGIHAASGLGLIDDEPRPAPLAYPDVVTALTAAAELLRLLACGATRAETTLAGSVGPLVAVARRDLASAVGR